MWESCTLAFPCSVNGLFHDGIASYTHFHGACLLVFGFFVRNSVVLTVYLLFSVACFFTVHEHYDAGSNHVQDKESATSIQAMRQASKNILYTVVNSRAYAEENMKPDFFTWKTAAVIIDVILAAGVLALEIMIFKRLKKETAK